MAFQPNRFEDEHYQEVVPSLATSHNVYDSSYEYYQPQTSPAPEYVPQRSPVPEYQAYSRSPALSSPSPRLSSASPPPGPLFTRSPSASDGAYKTSTLTNSAQYSEYHSPHPEKVDLKAPVAQYSEYQSLPPETVYPPNPARTYYPYVPPAKDDKEFYSKDGTVTGVVEAPLTIARKPVASQPQGPIEKQHGFEPQPPRKKPFYKRPLWIILGLVLLAIIAAAVACGVVLGTKKSKPSAGNASGGSPDGSALPHDPEVTGDPDVAVGGYLSPNYYSKSGAWNGSGIALAAARPGIDQTAYVFYQDYEGKITYKLMREDGSFSSNLGTVNDASSRPMNGTPLSVVNHATSKTNIVYHLFYIDEDYQMIERILQTGSTSGESAIPVWDDGPLTEKKLKTLEANTIGMQACFWNNYYGDWNVNSKFATDGIQLWFATSETQFAQYSWTNGTTSWGYDDTWNGLDGHAGVGCQTWDSWATEYVFFVDVKQNIAMYWRDNNQTGQSNSTHPTDVWTKINDIDIKNVHKSSSLGYTTYMLYQASDNSIRGANISWNAESTTVATSATTGNSDLFTIEDFKTNEPVSAVRGTHLTITALKTASDGAKLQVFFQQDGDDISSYTRDMNQVNGKWQQAPGPV